MLPVLVITGAIVVFIAGWAAGRGRHVEVARPVSPPPSPAGRPIAEVLDSHATGVVIADAAGGIEYRNTAVRRLGGTHSGVLLDEAIERHVQIGLRGVESGEVVALYGPPRMVFELSARPLATGGCVVFVDDISERRRIEQVRTDFVANVSHELKTPIGALSVLAETLQGETDPDTIERIAVRMLGEVERASNTIDDLLELSRIEAGNERADEPVRVLDVIRGAQHRVSELAARRGITISTLEPVDDDGHRSESIVVTGDVRQLVSALGNLVENEVKYSEPGGSVQIRARRNGPWAEISVADQGVGIPQRDLERIFERFYRVDRARSRSTGGTGLGLSIVRHVAGNHHGEVVVTSTEGEGSTFVLRLPAGVAPDTVVPPRSSEGVA
jgi:two-component system sensor histidine kinase SenX3